MTPNPHQIAIEVSSQEERKEVENYFVSHGAVKEIDTMSDYVFINSQNRVDAGDLDCLETYHRTLLTFSRFKEALEEKPMWFKVVAYNLPGVTVGKWYKI